jgi:hypothetical protein
LLLQHGQPHGDVEPVNQVLAEKMLVLLHPAYILAAIGQEHHLLVLLHALRLQQLPEPPARLLVVGLNEPETLRRRHLARIAPPESYHTLAGDYLKPSLLVRRANVAAVEPHRHRAIW